MDFNSIDLETCELLKLITENVGIFGAFDDLTNKRIIYFNKKIETLKKSQPVQPVKNTYDKTLAPTPSNTAPSPQNTNQASTGGFGLPDAEKGDVKARDANKERQAAEDARLNEIMRQQKLNSPIYITNGEPGKLFII